ncbi:MAG: uridine kinase, partial [Culicoidibacterales bacterium]
LVEHLRMLSEGKSISKPKYDFKMHTRSEETEIVKPTQVIIIEGLLILEDERIREYLDVKVYVDTDADVRILRRIKRDIEERGRTLDSVIEQYMNSVRPMHIQFIQPSKRFADVIIPNGKTNVVGIDLLLTKIKSILSEQNSV